MSRIRICVLGTTIYGQDGSVNMFVGPYISMLICSPIFAISVNRSFIFSSMSKC